MITRPYPHRYSMAQQRPVAGFGESFTATISTPVGDQKVTVDLPYEALLQKALQEAVTQGSAAAMPLLQSLLPQLMAQALPIAGDYIKNTFWPNTAKPLVEAEIQKAMDQAQTKVDDTVKKASIAGGIMLTGMMIAAYFAMRHRG